MKFSILATALALGQATAFTQSLVRNARAGTTALEDAGIPTDLLSPEQLPLVAGGLAAALGIGAVASRQGGSAKTEKVVELEPEPEPIDVSIPYDAAARLAFAEFCADREMEEDEAFYLNKFKKLYEEKTVATITLKQKEREFAALK